MKQEINDNMEHDISMGILEKMTGMDNQDLWLSPRLVVPK